MITYFFAALLTFLYVLITFKTIRFRRSKKILYGFGNESDLNYPSVAHGNFSAYVPLFLVLFFLLEHSGLGALALCCLGSVFFMGRCIHFYGICWQETLENPNFKYRVRGMQMTIFSLMMSSIYLMAQVIKKFL